MQVSAKLRTGLSVFVVGLPLWAGCGGSAPETGPAVDPNVGPGAGAGGAKGDVKTAPPATEAAKKPTSDK